ncbi:STAS domain-containing protein [Marinibactrum halimedae]|uniref:STAS domain-containing protein n=1 Tax=Marinibactrum halimedae TaxID=1444977 RepID=A0AA37T8W8_9GAMM|nr:STAS domain-containing protein [Marinibactrum halimedae]MCD9458847.1 STAS domain-containing protein [Marinibactrum halimedae]GLS27699.1 STAS domain-containing protein [Marinibactrum halimedae]
MAISSEMTPNGAMLKIEVSGRFDFSSHHDFRKTYEELDSKPESFLVDMKNATYLDSSALGMLLLLRDYAGGDESNIEITNCSPDIRKILTISNFEQLFAIN